MVHNFTSQARLVNQGYKEWGIALYGVGKTLNDAKENIGREYHFPQTLYMSCGYKLFVASPEKLPNQNIACPCGNPDHWVVKYELTHQPLYRRSLKTIKRLLRLS